MIQKYLNGIKINSIEGAKILKANGEVPQISGQAVFSYSMLLNKLIEQQGEKKLITQSKIGFSTRDIINIKFTYGLKSNEIKELNYEWLNKLAEENTKNNLEKLKEKKLKEIENKDFIENEENVEEYRNALREKANKKYRERINEIDEIAKRKSIEGKSYDSDKYKTSAKEKLYKQLNEIEVKKKFNKELSIAKVKNMKANDIDNLSAEVIREYLYKNGFIINYPVFKKNKETKEYEEIGKETIKYKFWFRSSAKARIGEVLFINEKYYDEIVKWQMMNIEMELNKPCKLVEMMAYMSLTASSIEGSVIIKPDEILVINDLESSIEKDVLDVVVENKKCKVIEGRKSVKNVLFDGQALLDNSLFTDNAGMKLLRHHMFKACGFRTYISKFYKDYCKENGLNYDTYTVTDRYGNDIRVKDIKLITTENAMKWEKFLGATKEGFDKWKAAVENDGCEFGVVKRDHESKIKDFQWISYQMLNALMINKEETRFLFNNTSNFINGMKKDNSKYINYLKITESEVNENSMILDLIELNRDFIYSDMFRKQKTNTLKKLKNELKEGRILVCGDNLTVVGNPYLMLKASVGNKEVIDETLSISENNDYISVYTSKFKDGEMLAGFRNPFNSPNNLSYFKNETKDSLINKYFNFSDNIIAINLIKTDAQDRNNGMDQDSDFMLVTNDLMIVNKAKNIYKKYPTIVNSIPKSNKEYINNSESKAEIDNLLAKAKSDIGVSSNLAQIALSRYSDSKDKKIRDTVVIMSVLAQVAIDNAKRQYEVDVEKECNRLRIEGAKPLFFKYTQGDDIEKYMDADEKRSYKGMDREAKTAFLEKKKREVDKEKEIKSTELKEKYKKIINGDTEIEKIKDIEIPNFEEFNDFIKSRRKFLQKNKKVIDKIISAKAKMESEYKFNYELKCPMNFLQYIIEEELINANRGKGEIKIDTLEFVKKVEGKAKTKQMDKIEELVQEWDKQVKVNKEELSKLKDKEEINEIKKRQNIEELEMLENINLNLSKMKLSDKTMQMLIKNALSDKDKKSSTSYIMLKIFKVLHKNFRNQFLKMFKEEIA